MKPVNLRSNTKHPTSIVKRTLATILLSGIAGHAAADLDVWYQDYNNNFQYGDIADGNTVLTPPSYACARRFTWASYYRWMGYSDELYGEISSGNFNKDVMVWIPKAGCPYTNEIVVEYTDGSHTFDPPLGRCYLEIHTDYGSQWVDENGESPSCANCVGPQQFQVEQRDWDELVGTIVGLKASDKLTKPSILFKQFDVAAHALETLQAALKHDANEAMRRIDPQRSATIESIEKRIQKSLATSLGLLESCEFDLQRDAATAYRTCNLAQEQVETAKAVWSTFRNELR